MTINRQKVRRIKPRKKMTHLENLSISQTTNLDMQSLASVLMKQINNEDLQNKYAPVKVILALVGTGAFIAGSFAFSNLPTALKPFLNKTNNFDVWKQFNVSYIKRALKRLEEQKLIEIIRQNDLQTINITATGERKLFKYALNELAITKPMHWDKTWRLISYDIPKEFKSLREAFQEYLKAWGFYPLQESVYLHAYPCEKEITYLRNYLGIEKYVRIFTVWKIENDDLFREFFGI